MFGHTTADPLRCEFAPRGPGGFGAWILELFSLLRLVLGVGEDKSRVISDAIIRRPGWARPLNLDILPYGSPGWAEQRSHERGLQLKIAPPHPERGFVAYSNPVVGLVATLGEFRAALIPVFTAHNCALTRKHSLTH